MPIKLTGMISGMDTDTIVKELMKSYSGKKDKLTKTKTKAEWTQDAWKDMNKSIYGFYTKNLSNMRLSGTYNAKKVSVSKEGIAKVSGSSSAVNGTQTLKVKQLAKSGYLTGGVIDSKDGSKLTASTKLTDVKGMEDLVGSKISINGKDIEITEDMNLGQLANKMKETGVNASFDANNKRFYISAKESGKAADFTITAADTKGISALKALGLFTGSKAETAEYEKYANMSDEDVAKLKADTAAKQYSTVENYTKKLNDEVDSLKKTNESLTKANEDLTKKNEELEAQKLNDTLTDADKEAIQKKIDDNNKTISENNDKVTANTKTIDDNTSMLSDETALSSKVAELNADIDKKVSDSIDDKIAAAKAALATAADGNDDGTGAVRIEGQDSEIWLNGAKYTGTTNSFSINGLTIQAEKETGDEEVTINTDTDVDGVYNMIKGFFKEYNKLVNLMDEKYNAASSKGYEPLTDEEKEAMSDDEVEKWEKKIKDSLLRGDSTLSGVSSAMKNIMARSYDINGKKMSLSSFGIKTLGYFESAENERGAYHIDGDTDDENTSGNADKLKAAIANDPESVINFFQKLSTDLYDEMTKKMKGTTLSSAYTVYNDKQMASTIKDYTKKISNMEDYLQDKEDYWYNKFTAMEKALSKLQSSTSGLTGLFGGQ